MPLKAITTKEEYDVLGSEVQAHYTPVEDNPNVFRLGVTPVEGIELAPVSNLRSALQKERSSAENFKKALGLFDGITAEQARNAISELKVLEVEGGTDKTRDEIRVELESTFSKKFDIDKETLTKKFTIDIESKDKTIGNLTNQLEKHLIENAAIAAINEAGGSTALLLPLIAQRAKVVASDNGTLGIKIIGDDGTERLSPKAGSIDSMSIAELVGELRADTKFGGAFKASGTSGSGATSSSSGFPSSGQGEIRLTREAATDPATYRAAKEQAEKSGRTLVIDPPGT